MIRAVATLALMVATVVLVFTFLPRTEAVPSAPAVTVGPTVAARPTKSPLQTCVAGDQDKYVYSPDRLTVLQPCVRISGTVVDIQRAEDGDFHIDVKVDQESAAVLTPGNATEGAGYLIVEPVCVHAASPVAEGLCKTDPDPVDMSKLAAGQHVWMEGRYVLDSEHSDWAELHPLYAWGVIAP